MNTKQGIITGTSMQRTVTVTVHRRIAHDLYKKSFRVSRKFLADTNGVDDLAVGDEVVIQECRPISKRKYFRVTDVIKRAPRVSDLSDEAAGLGSAAERPSLRKHDDESDSSDAS